MKNITVVGDSHASALGVALSEASRLYKLDMFSNSIVFSGRSAYTLDYETLVDRSNIQHDTTILLNFGECDIRRHLPKHKNAEQVVEKYVNTSLKFFDGLNIVFMLPTPQAIDQLTYEFNYNKDDWHTFDRRLKQQTIFYEALKNSGQKVIDIVDALGVDRLGWEESDDGCHLKRSLLLKLGVYIYNAVD
jgi:hypothetical protein